MPAGQPANGDTENYQQRKQCELAWHTLLRLGFVEIPQLQFGLVLSQAHSVRNSALEVVFLPGSLSSFGAWHLEIGQEFSATLGPMQVAIKDLRFCLKIANLWSEGFQRPTLLRH